MATTNNETLAAMSSPLLLQPQASRPPQLDLYQTQVVSSIHSGQDSPIHGFRQISHKDMERASRLPLRKYGTIASTNSKPPSIFRNPSPLQPLSIIEHNISRPTSGLSIRTVQSSKPSRLDIVLVQLSFEGKGNRIMPLDLTKCGDEILPYLDSQVLKISHSQLDRSVHEITITPLKENGSQPLSASLSEGEFDYSWDVIVD